MIQTSPGGFAADLERIKFAIGAAGIGVWEIVLSNNEVVWDARCCALFGFSEPFPTLPLDRVFEFIYPEDLPAVAKTLEEAIAGERGGALDVTCRITRADGARRWINATGTSYFDTVGQMSRFGGVARDVTEQVAAREQVENSEARFQNLVHHAAVGIILLTGEDLRVEMVNEAGSRMLGQSINALLHQPLFQLIPHAEDYYQPIISKVLRTGEEEHLLNIPYQHTNAGGQTEDGFVTVTYQPYREEKEGAISGVLILIYDITEQTLAARRALESETKFRSLVEEAPFATVLYMGPELIVDTINEAMIKFWGKGPNVLGIPLAKALPELEGQPFLGIIKNVYETGIPYETQEQEALLVHNGKLQSFWFIITYTPLRNAAGDVYGILNMAMEVTEQVLSRKKIHESEARFRALIEEAPIAACLFMGPELRLEIANEALLRIINKDRSVIGKPFVEAMPEIKDQPFPAILKHVFMTGETHTGNGEPALINMGGYTETHYFDYTYQPLRDDAGTVYAVMNIATNVTGRALLIQKLRESETNLTAAIELAELATWNVDLRTKEVTFSERLQDWLGAKKAISDGGNSSFVHPNDRLRVTVAMEKATAKGSDGYYDEVYTILNAVDGSARVIHATGRAHFDEDGNALRLSGTAQDVTIQRDLQSKLEAEVKIRTEELAAAVSTLQTTNETLADLNEKLTRSNEELGQYAYVASHDLQEPLRKIQLFADLLNNDAAISEKSQNLVGKIVASAARMSQLIRGLLDLSRLLQSEPEYAPVNLNEVVEEVETDLELVIAEKKGQIVLQPLPTIDAIGLQIHQLFLNLVGNGLKFTRPGTTPIITVTADVASPELVQQFIRTPRPGAVYHRLCVRDNGIGFETQYADQIFEVFKRLHGREEYPGAGIGLALCRRIVANHGGVLYTESKPGEGAAFYMLLPGKFRG